MYWIFISPRVIKNRTMLLEDIRERSTGRNLYLVIQKALNVEIINKIKREFNDSPKLLKKVSRTIKNIIVGTMNLRYFEICINDVYIL